MNDKVKGIMAQIHAACFESVTFAIARPKSVEGTERIESVQARIQEVESAIVGMQAVMEAAEFAVSMWAGGPVSPSELDEALNFLSTRLLELHPVLAGQE